MENNINLNNFDIKSVKKRLEYKNALCPICERRLKYVGAVSILKIKNQNYFVAICRKCEYKKEKKTEAEIKNSEKLIESRLIENIHPYSCEKVEDDNIDKIMNNVVSKDSNLTISGIISDGQEWHKADEQFFKDNPSRRFYIRPIFKNELDEICKDNNEMKAESTYIKFAVVHSLGGTQRVYTYVTDLTGHPYEEEAFAAALFMIRVNDFFTIDDLPQLFEQIKANNDIINNFNLNDHKNKN